VGLPVLVLHVWSPCVCSIITSRVCVCCALSQDTQLRIDVSYRGLSVPIEVGAGGAAFGGQEAGGNSGAAGSGTYLDRGCVSVMAGVGPFAPEPSK